MASKEAIYYTNLKSYSDMVYTRNILIEQGYIKKYDKTNPGTNKPGVYYLNYQKIKDK